MPCIQLEVNEKLELQSRHYSMWHRQKRQFSNSIQNKTMNLAGTKEIDFISKVAYVRLPLPIIIY